MTESLEDQKSFEQCESCSHNCVCVGYENGFLFDDYGEDKMRTGICEFVKSEGKISYCIVDGRTVPIEYSSFPKVTAAYDSVQDIIYISKKALSNKRLFDYLLEHEIYHAKKQHKIFAHTIHDLKSLLFRPTQIRKDCKIFLPKIAYWRMVVANLALQTIIALPIAIVIFIFNVLGWI